MTKKKEKANPIGLDSQQRYPSIVDELIRVAKLEGPEAYEKLLKSDIFKMATEFDPRYHPEVAHENSDKKTRN